MVDTEEFAGVAVHVGGDEPAAGWVDVEVTGLDTAGGFVSDGCELAVNWVDGKDGDAFVSAIRGVDEATVWGDEDFGGPADFVVVGGEGVDDLLFGEGTGGGFVIVKAEGGCHLVEHVDEASVRVKGQVTRACSGSGSDEATIC